MRLLFKVSRATVQTNIAYTHTHTHHITQSNQFLNQSAVLMVGGCHFFPLLLEVSPCHPISFDLQSYLVPPEPPKVVKVAVVVKRFVVNDCLCPAKSCRFDFNKTDNNSKDLQAGYQQKTITFKTKWSV